MRQRVENAAPLALLAGLATVGVLTLSGGSPLRVVAGIALIFVLPWLAASRLAPLRDSDLEGGRISGSGALALALVVLLGLLLSTGDDGIATSGVAVGLSIATTALALLDGKGGSPFPRPRLDAGRALALGLTVAAVAIAVLAFAIARDRALTQAREETAYAAFLASNGAKLDVGLTNSTRRGAQFTVREVGEGGREATVTVPPRSTRMVAGFVDRPPGLRPLERVAPRRIEPVRIRVTVSVGGRRAAEPLALSTYAPAGSAPVPEPRSSRAQSRISRSSPRANRLSASR
jgi:hypothetical protein